MTPEGRVKDRIKKRLKEMGAYYHMPVQNGLGAPALDFHVCMPVLITPEMVGTTIGVYVAIESKAPGKDLTPRQRQTSKEVREARGVAVKIDGEDLSVLTDIRMGVRTGERIITTLGERRCLWRNREPK